MNQVIPKQIAIEISNRCNLSCLECLYNYDPRPKIDMSFEFFKSIIDRNTFDATIVPFMWNEPLLHPDIFKMMEYVINKNQRCYITTNGMIWSHDLFKLITEKNSCYQLIVSLDGLPDSKSIETCRPGTYRERVLENIRDFMDLKEKKGNNIDFCLKICNRGQDWEEIENFIYYWLGEGVDYICVGRMLNQSGNVELRKYPCQYFEAKFMLIRADGEIVPCMYSYETVIKNYFQIGKLNMTDSLVYVYNNHIFNVLREDQNRGIFNGPCKTCQSAYTGQGLRAQYKFNDPGKQDIGILYGSVDYYNMTFSLKDKAEGIQYES